MVEIKDTVIYQINGPVVTAKNAPQLMMKETVLVGNDEIVGEVIAVHGDAAVIQVYEDTTGLKAGEPVKGLGVPLSVTLAPGLIGNVLDGTGRPLHIISSMSGAFISRGIQPDAVDMDKKWEVQICSNAGDEVAPCSIIGMIQETGLVVHRIMVPQGIKGRIAEVAESGSYTCRDVIAKIKSDDGTVKEIGLVQKWAIRTPRPYLRREPVSMPLVTGQRVIDVLFPVAKGGTAAIPGGFGTGKTMTQHQLAKWCDADIIIYIGCGERGNEMTQVLEDFGGLIDPKSGRPLIERTLLIANTSNMPVAAREASVYTGVTIAEFYRDMGYHVAIMADSTSRWAEALREISGRLEEMPAEEGYPAYLPSRLSEFYERAGFVTNLNRTVGSITIIGAVSPQGGDFSEPVTQNTKRFTRCFWGLDKNLAYSRHYPAINWLTSYSDYADELSPWYRKNAGDDFADARVEAINILREESALSDIVKLIGADVLPEEQKLTLAVSELIRVGFLQQNAYNKNDTFVPIKKQFLMLKVILYLYNKCRTLVAREKMPVSQMRKSGIFETVVKMKYETENDDLTWYDKLIRRIDELEF